MSLASNHDIVLNGIVVANLNLGAWVLDAWFVVIMIMKYYIILKMNFLYNAKARDGQWTREQMAWHGTGTIRTNTDTT